MEKTTVKQVITNIFKFPNLWGSIIPLQFVGIYGLYLIFTDQAPNWWWIGLIVGYILFTILGISIGYHRLLCHNSFKTNLIIKRVLLYLAMLAGQGGPIYWIGIHKGYHHRFADTYKDAHSPKNGFVHSYIGWMFKMNSMSLRSVYRLFKDPDLLFSHKYYQLIFWFSHIIIAFISFEIWLWFMGFPVFITLHLFFLQTSITHLGKIGYRNYNVKDNSVNVPWLFPILLGESWHNNHHGEVRNPNFGGRQWWEIDPAFWLIKLIRKSES